MGRIHLRRLAAIALLAAALGLLLVGTRTSVLDAAHAGLHLPAPQGTQWRIVAGYNIGGHSYNAPHAIDIVRTDAPTEGTRVLAPLSGVIAWFDASCVVIDDARGGFAVLICHFFPNGTVTRGARVTQGQELGTVAPPGYAENNGLAHLHLAVHHSSGAGTLGVTVPFSGRFALEGRSLPDTSEDNAYADVTFTSSNLFGGGDPDFLFPGWNLIGWTADADVAAATASIRNSIGSVLTFSGETQSFQRYSPALPPTLNDLTVLAYGDGLWVYVRDLGGVVWERPRRVGPRSVALQAGFNLVTWTGAAAGLSTATAGIDDALVAVYAYDARWQRYRVYRPGPLIGRSTLTRLDPGQAVWVQVRSAVQWLQE